MIDAFASQLHYLDHLAPVWHALPESVRGAVYVSMNRPEFEQRAARLGLPLAGGVPPYRGAPELLIMAGGVDLWAWESRPVVLLEHGAGQHYNGHDSVSYAGGIGRDAVVLFLCPNEETAGRNRIRYPNARSVAVGAPHLDPITTPPENLVAMSWHFDASPIAIEAMCTWPYWQNAALALARARPVLGHAHPKMQHAILPWWREHGVECTADFTDVLRRAAVYCVDNSSTLYEFAACDRPVVVLDHPRYRRDVEHGLRFWRDADVGVRIGDPELLVDAVELALLDPPNVRDQRREIIARVYVALGQPAADHAAREILHLV